MLPSLPCTKSSTVIAIINGISTRTVERATASGVIAAAIPRITRIFKILLPTILPIVISALPFIAAAMLTAASGALVPIATIVRPTTSCGMPKRVASAAAPSTNQSAPLPSITKPKANNKNCNKISISFLLALQPPAQQKKRDLCCKHNNSQQSLATYSQSRTAHSNRIDDRVNTQIRASYSLYMPRVY